ncbi:uncharacterized protein A1O9_10312 [Exophiala aquamarina CBS 119918]|uniref:NAD-dependent epimerase/dehydratase domain-containing protein n=1 Tax=Exophiala aquamarina CBS 119918 TaxID=1182545 RepID=A0A072PEC9_9EURO|nr:uncharacterized protein A1O9_10312 [Exophiala aquamarina CBS 119918]KEF53910.1 hypothetical protein A1O9_10312 [Exophiala aquamarina CBS 119918]
MENVESRLDPGSIVLVTGANGYIGSTIADLLLQEGYYVRGTVRGHKPWLQRYFDEKYGKMRFEAVVVPDLGVQEDLVSALEGAQGLIHVAADVAFQPDAEKIISQTKMHTVAALQAAARVSTMRSFVLTSSASAACSPSINEQGIAINDDTWNDRAVAAAWCKTTSPEELPYNVYAAAKTEGEQVLWKFARENNPTFTVNTVLPSACFGSILCREIGGSTMGVVRRVLSGDSEMFSLLPPQWFVDVTDCARLHLAALIVKSIADQRIFAFAETFNWTDIITILRHIRPGNNDIPEPPAHEGRDLSHVTPRLKAECILRQYWNSGGWTSLGDSIAAGIGDIS